MAMASRLPLVKSLLRYLVSLGNDCVEKIERLFYSQREIIDKKKYDITNKSALLDFLDQYKEVFQIRKEDSDYTVVPTTELSVCKQHCKKSGSCAARCAKLHTCVYFLLSGKCVHGDSCHFGHSLADPHNSYLLENHLLSDLNLTELRTLFSLPWVRRGVLVPKVCRYYNGAKGCNRPDCRCLHICRFYYNSPGDTKCRFGRNCKRNHDIQHPQVQDVLKLYGFETARPIKDLLGELRRLPADDDDDDDRRSNDSADLIGLWGNGRRNDFVQPMEYWDIPQPYPVFRNSSPDFDDRWLGDGAVGRISREYIPRSSPQRRASVSPSVHHGFASEAWQTTSRMERIPWSSRQDEDSYRNRPATSRGRSAGPRARATSRYMERSRSRSSSRAMVELDMRQEQRRRTQAFGDTADRFSASRQGRKSRERRSSGERIDRREMKKSRGRRFWRQRRNVGRNQQPRPQATAAGVPERGLAQPGQGWDRHHMLYQELERERQARRQAKERQLDERRRIR